VPICFGLGAALPRISKIEEESKGMPRGKGVPRVEMLEYSMFILSGFFFGIIM